MNTRLLYLWLLALIATPAAFAQSPSLSSRAALQDLPAFSTVSAHFARSTARPRTSRPDAVLYQEWDGTTWPVKGSTLYTYKNLVRHEEWTYVRDGQALRNDKRTTFIPVNQRPVPALVEHWNPALLDFQPHTQTLYNFIDDTNTRIAREFTQVWTNGQWEHQQRTAYVYADGGAAPYAERVFRHEWSGSGWVNAQRETITTVGQDVVLTEELWDSTAWVNHQRFRYPDITHATLADLLARFQEDDEDFGQLLLPLRSLPPFIHEEWTGSEWVNVERLVIDTYQWPDGKPMVLRFDVWNGEAWEAASELRFTYTAHGSLNRLSAAQISFIEEGTAIPFYGETYQYNEQGHLVKAELSANRGAGLTPYAWYSTSWKQLPPVGVEDEEAPAAYALAPAYPNPFNPATTLAFDLAASGPAAVRVYDALGRLVATLADGRHTAGRHEVRFEAAGLPSGRYFVRLEAAGFSQTRTVTLLK